MTYFLYVPSIGLGESLKDLVLLITYIIPSISIV